MTTTDEQELREAVKRFCRTEQAADNLVAYIEAQKQRVAIEARVAEDEKLSNALDSMHFVGGSAESYEAVRIIRFFLDKRIETLKSQLPSSDKQEKEKSDATA